MIPGSTPVESFARITPRQKAALAKLGIRTARDLLFHFPARYEELGGLKRISELAIGEKAMVIAEVVGVQAEKTWKRKMRIAEGIVRDETGSLGVVWFNQPYVAGMLKPGMTIRLTGKVSRTSKGLAMANPMFSPAERYDPDRLFPGGLMPVYPEAYGITSRWFRAHIERIFGDVDLGDDLLPGAVISKYRLPAFLRALRAVHFPKSISEAEAAKKRFSFEEIFLIQLGRQQERRRLENEPAFSIKIREDVMEKFAASLPFPLTGAQHRAIRAILESIERPHPMARLLEGDVGSGKTLVAAAAALNVVSSGYQILYIAPTEILARQHFEEFSKRLLPFRVRIGLLTSSEARKFPSKIRPRESAHVSKNQLVRWCANGEIQILIGTHAVIEDRVKFKKLALAVVDEQHRFGIRQRRAAAKGARPHFLSMSATPIPRTLALTVYGDLDLTVLDEMPPGREPVETKIVLPAERGRTYEKIREEIRSGGQAFVICPRIDDPDSEEARAKKEKKGRPRAAALPLGHYAFWDDVKSVKAEYKKLSEEIFPEFRIGMVHGKLLPKDKENVMRKFKEHQLDILVSTSVVEVGVDVPNASVMMIEGGERFGLAQLHQFRGRVGRGGRKSYCFVFTTSADQQNSRRLQALAQAKTGFELAECDLQFRGPGELSGAKQWGVSDVGMEALKNIKMVEAARAEAQALVRDDPELQRYPRIGERVREIARNSHFE